MTYAFVTFGCRVNQADSLALEGQLRARGGTPAASEHADLVIVNTCSVTASADQGARQTIRRVARDNPSARVVVTGCYASRCHDEVAKLPNVVQVVPNSRKDALVDLLEWEPATAQRFGDGDGPCGGLAPGVGGRTTLTLRVQTGCDESCSYCIIPHTRGPGRSRRLELVAADIARAVEAGYKEIVITGVHLGSYGRDIGGGTTLTTLVRRLAEWPGEVLFRLSSLEPMDCTDTLVDIVASSPNLAPHFHLPLQHGSDRVLRAMRRPYTAGFYRRLAERLRARLPDAALGSDLIVGFPGETADDFEESRALVARLPLTQLHVFPYSDRPGTEASGMAGKVEGAVVRERGRVMRQLGADLVERFRRSQAGTTRRALTVDDGWSAVTDNYLKVHLARPHVRNTWVNVTVTCAEAPSAAPRSSRVPPRR
jgi:threonylcarbamoyladenosine tRNA methylthiotransferase MtaB